MYNVMHDYYVMKMMNIYVCGIVQNGNSIALFPACLGDGYHAYIHNNWYSVLIMCTLYFNA